MTESTPQEHRCPTCKSTSTNPRNLAVFIDGTSNKPGHKRTNVMKLYEFMLKGSSPELEQRGSYFEGIGVYENINTPLSSYLPKVIYSISEMGFAWNVERNVKEAYAWLAGTYQQGDQIYLFGFSRGAYQVRELAGMIHEVGLVKEKREKRIDQAYQQYLSLNPPNPKTRESATEFKKNFCWPGVRIHFIGVWDTVSSLGFIKQDVHITTSASVTNACHFRHALALDERRVKFIPEYFLEGNTEHSNDARGPRSTVSDIQEVWFAGYHADVGGTSRLRNKEAPNPVGEDYPIHAGNVPLVWMRQAVTELGLAFKSEEFPLWPEDIDLGRKDSMKWYWGILEGLPIRHQVLFSGAARHERRMHRSRPRLIIPGQHIHFSAFPGDVYTPHATLANGVEIPTVSGELWSAGEEEATKKLLESLLRNEQCTLRSLGAVLRLLGFRLDKGQTIPAPAWGVTSVYHLSGLDKIALTVIYNVTSNFSIPEDAEGPVKNARDLLCELLPHPNGLDFPTALYILRFSARHQELRRRFVAHDKAISALIAALDSITKSRNRSLFPLVMESLSYLINDDHTRASVVNLLTATPDGTQTGKKRLLLALEVKTPSHLVASLKMITSVAQHQPRGGSPTLLERDLEEKLKSRITKLAKKERGAVGTAGVEALVAFGMQRDVYHDVHVFNIVGYLSNTLPRLDVEMDGASSPNGIGDLPVVLQNNGGGLDHEVMRKLLSSINSYNACQRIAATLTFLKLRNNSDVQNFERDWVLNIFMKQLKRKETSLLAAYALSKLDMDMWQSGEFDRPARLILAMLDRGWFDDAVGRMEGPKIFRDLMRNVNLRGQVKELGAVNTLEEKLGTGNRHETRMSLIYLEIFWTEEGNTLDNIVVTNIKLLGSRNEKEQVKGVKTLSALAQTERGEQAIMPHLMDIVNMLLPPSSDQPTSRSQLFGPSAAVSNLCKNEALRKEILQSEEYNRFKTLRRNSTLYPQN